jgi:hypothetical protein
LQYFVLLDRINSISFVYKSFSRRYIINKAGGLIYMKSLSDNSAKISINDALRLISTFHSMHAIAGRLSPIDRENSGIETIETNTFKLQVWR